jgi:4-hydroxy-3-methylbut-2-enyl diphosphate reductase
MIVTVESKAKPCPGVEQAVARTEDVLRRGDVLYSVGELIHNRREVERLKGMGLRDITLESLDELFHQDNDGAHFLVRTHGESEEVIQKVREFGLHILDTTCPFVRHSQELVEQHVREGWGILIAGDKAHAEVKGLMARAAGWGTVVSSKDEAETLDFEDRSVLLAQTTINPVLFSDIRETLSVRATGLKIVDTTCRFLINRQTDIRAFSSLHDVLLFIGGNNSANCSLLHQTALEVNERAYRVEEPCDVSEKWFHKEERIGISGGASTPRWQLEEMRSYLENHSLGRNPKGLKNKKGGTFLCLKWRQRNKTK